ncbi:hypothetical protein [Deinococcus sp. JMULE3]|uniref:hypothetical protein n=1 Tax=Deinococcus sp. JMULE3 TaxID=2518341 RepID=UPI0015776A0F|nr:hypothetical protein [Deinococcus sp. JMULE3]NTX99273.1 hypothetical protein [Deinococcus sp. JMULE3]
MNELVSPTGRRTIINALLTLPQDWNWQAPVQVRAADLDVAMTVAPEGIPPFLAANHCQSCLGYRVTLHTDETGLRIVEASSTPADRLEPHAYLLQAYHVAPQWCDAAARGAGVPSWADLVHGLKFKPRMDLTRHLGLYATLPRFDILTLSGLHGGLPSSLVNFHIALNRQGLTIRDGRAA